MQNLCPTLEASWKLYPLLAVTLRPVWQPRPLLLSPVCWRVCSGRCWTRVVGCEPVIWTKWWLPGVCSCSIPRHRGAVPLWTWEVKRPHRFPTVNPESCKRYYVTGVRGRLWSSAASLDKNLDLEPWKLFLPLQPPIPFPLSCRCKFSVDTWSLLHWRSGL